MIEKYLDKSIMVSHGVFEVGTYGKYSYRGEVLHMPDSYVYGNSEEEVLTKMKKILKEKYDNKN